MPQQEQWSYLLRGRGLEDGDSSAVQSMLIGFGVSQFGGVVTSIGEKIGLSDVTLDTQGSGDDTRVTIGGTIAPGLRVQYGAGVFDSIAEVKVRYELMPRLYLQAVSGIAQAIDLFYQFTIATEKK
ncbi:translocation/assembly module TamB domain-containing protein [Endozoicomonas sp. GU-1]|nr:translocation/assembly module TamB domain-containing protein [Endozoicomonas sp. GU-1]WBA88558.1 translocation/assembly module TamB domain-containing protein [Endozoicomonas sp. GU-1]